MPSRYDRRRILNNNLERYEPLLEKRHKSSLRHYNTFQTKKIEIEQLQQIEKRAHRWVASDKFFKLASVYYDNPELWWIIAYFNEKPTENHCTPGDLIFVPLPLERVLSILEVY